MKKGIFFDQSLSLEVIKLVLGDHFSEPIRLGPDNDLSSLASNKEKLILK